MYSHVYCADELIVRESDLLCSAFKWHCMEKHFIYMRFDRSTGPTAPTVTPLSKDWISRDNRRSGGREWGKERTGVVGKKEAISFKNGRRKRRDCNDFFKGKHCWPQTTHELQLKYLRCWVRGIVCSPLFQKFLYSVFFPNPSRVCYLCRQKFAPSAPVSQLVLQSKTELIKGCVRWWPCQTPVCSWCPLLTHCNFPFDL